MFKIFSLIVLLAGAVQAQDRLVEVHNPRGENLRTETRSDAFVSRISTSNSTTTPLLAGTTFTGNADDLLGFMNVSVFIHTDQDSESRGVILEFSPDAVNWDFSDQYNHTLVDPLRYLTVGSSLRYFRLRYVNGPVDQGEFRVQTILHQNAPKPSSHRVGDSISADNDAEIGLSVLTGLDDGSGRYVSVRTEDGKLLTKSETTAGNTTIEGKRFVSSTGQRTKVGASESAEVLVVNFSTNTINLVLDRQFFTSIDQGVNLLFRFYHDPIFTSSGTVVDTQNALLGDPTINTGEVFFQPTTTSFGTVVNTYQSRDTMIIDETSGRIVIPPGQPVLITVESSGNNKKWSYSIAWTEEAI